MLRKINHIQDVVDWGLCVGCGACFYACKKDAVTLHNRSEIGIRPAFKQHLCRDCSECLPFCPGYTLDSSDHIAQDIDGTENHPLIGPLQAVYEGHASDRALRFNASSGGVLSALALYCLERENAEFVLHVGMNPGKPWENMTVRSYTREDLFRNAGSRYAPSSPCDGLRYIEEAKGPCVFIGKPCDVAAVSQLRKQRPALDKNLSLVLTFFCAGPPCTKGTTDLVHNMGIRLDDVSALKYRGQGWPGDFTVTYNNGSTQQSLSYKESWGLLAKYPRSFRCHLCPDGLGEYADISSGDAWHKYSEDGDPGRSLILIRSGRGKKIFQKAVSAGYLEVVGSNAQAVMSAQGLPRRRAELFGRILAMHMLVVPVPLFRGYPLFKVWLKTSPVVKIKTIMGTLRRLLLRGLWHRNPVFPSRA